MSITIKKVQNNSIAEKYGLVMGDVITAMDDKPVNDMLDYEFYTGKQNFKVTVLRHDKEIQLNIDNQDYLPFGCDFETYLIDKKHSCKNKCMFCFIDQLPKGMRENLYFKDDDERLSFLYGNYITLTNLTKHEVDRIIKMKISPINISVHTVDPDLRVKMMTNKTAGDVLKYIDDFAQAGIKINAQIVLCNGVNDGEKLKETLQKLISLYPSVQSIAAVPFGKTRYRDGLYPLETYTKETAKQTLDILLEYGDISLEKNGVRLIYPADELFLLAEYDIPDFKFYEDFPQLENGVGMYRQFLDSFEQELENNYKLFFKRKLDVATGELAYPLLQNASNILMQKHKKLDIKVHSIKNNFFGGNVAVTGLICATDLIDQLQDNMQSKKLIICESMLRDEDNTFLDDISVTQLQDKLKAKVLISPQTGSGFVNTCLG